jgi:hypothetical protein
LTTTLILWIYFYSRIKPVKIKNSENKRVKKIHEISMNRLIYNPRKKIFEKVLDIDEEDVEVL